MNLFRTGIGELSVFESRLDFVAPALQDNQKLSRVLFFVKIMLNLFDKDIADRFFHSMLDVMAGITII